MIIFPKKIKKTLIIAVIVRILIIPFFQLNHQKIITIMIIALLNKLLIIKILHLKYYKSLK